MSNDLYYAIPDLHGRYDLLRMALDHIEKRHPEGGRIVFLGDYIDRGKQNREVVEAVMCPPHGWEYVCLMGNHEQMFLDAYDDEHMTFWDIHAALEFVDTPTASKQVFRNSFPKDVLDWMKNLRLCHIEGPNVFAHAFYDGSKPPSEQIEHTLLWQRVSDKFGFFSKDGLYLTHGHTPRANGPVRAMNRTNLDCGAVFNDRLVFAEYRKDVKGPVKFYEVTPKYGVVEGY